jgi:hypothetical protein
LLKQNSLKNYLNCLYEERSLKNWNKLLPLPTRTDIDSPFRLIWAVYSVVQRFLGKPFSAAFRAIHTFCGLLGCACGKYCP